ncbi:zinc ribbon-containing protein [Aurantivibrio plasticivorans]
MAEYDMDETEERQQRNPLERLRDTFKEEVDELVKLELDVEDLAHRKAGLLKQYLKDDLHGVQEFWEDLKAETHTLEEFAGQWLLQAANPTPLDWVKLDQYMEKGENRLMAGEIATDVELRCVGCGKLRVVDGTVTLAPCTSCGCELYQIRRS